MNEFVLNQTNRESNFNFTQLPEYAQQQSKAQGQDLNVNFDITPNINNYHQSLFSDLSQMNNQVIDTMPSKLQNVNVEHDNVMQYNQAVFSAGGQYIAKDGQGVLKDTHRKNPTQIKEFIPEDYNYGDDFRRAYNIGKQQQIIDDFKKQIPQMRQARIDDTVKVKGVNLDRAKGEFHPTFEVEQKLANNAMLHTYEMSQYNQNENYGNAYYKRIEAEALNRTDQTADHQGLQTNQTLPTQLMQDPKQLKFVPQPQDNEAKKVRLRQHMAQNSFSIMKFNPTQNPCLANFLSRNMINESHGVLPFRFSKLGGQVINPDKSITQNNRPQIFSRTFEYNTRSGGHVINPDKSITQNNRPQVFERTYQHNAQPDQFKRTKGSNYNFAMTQNWQSRNLAGATYGTNINYDPIQMELDNNQYLGSNMQDELFTYLQQPGE